jgi:hypothetical protein
MIVSPKRCKEARGAQFIDLFILPAGQMTHASAPVDNTVRIGEVAPA